MEENYNSVVLDLLLTSKVYRGLISMPDFEASKWADDYKNFIKTADKNLRDKIKSIKMDMINYYEMSLLDNYAKVLNIGMKIGMQFKHIDDLLNPV